MTAKKTKGKIKRSAKRKVAVTVRMVNLLPTLFKEILEDIPAQQAAQLSDYHRAGLPFIIDIDIKPSEYGKDCKTAFNAYITPENLEKYKVWLVERKLDGKAPIPGAKGVNLLPTLFKEILEDIPAQQAAQLSDYHRAGLPFVIDIKPSEYGKDCKTAFNACITPENLEKYKVWLVERKLDGKA